MVFTVTANTEQPPDPPPQQGELVDVLVQDQAMSQYSNSSNTYVQPFNTTYQQVAPAGQAYVQPTDGRMYSGDTGHLLPTPYTVDPFPCAPYDCSSPVTPQHQMYSCVSEPNSDFTTTTNPFTADHSHYQINNVLPMSLPGAETNPFLPQTEICDNVSSNPFHTFSANDPTFPDSALTSSSTDSYNTITENELITDLGITDQQNTYLNDHNSSQQMPLDASNSNTDDNMTVNQVRDVNNSEYQKDYLDEQYDQSAKNGSADDISMNSVSEVYNSTYTDTVSSVDSAQYLIKPTDSDNDVSQQEPVKEIYLNNGFVSGSSTEILNENDDTNSEEDTTKYEDDAESENKPLLGNDVDSVEEQKEENESTESGKEPEDPVQQIEDFVHHHLFPIAENEVITIDIQEIETPTSSHLPIPPSPKLSSFPYGKITNNLTVADESFLFQSQTSLWDLNTNKQGKRAATMQNLHERSSFLDLTEVARIGRACQKALIYLKDDLTFGSLISLNTMAAKNFKDPSPQAVSLIEEDKKIDIIASTKHRKNLIALSICISLLFISMGSVRNLQSSLNQEGGVGIISMALSFGGYMVGSIFSSSIVQNFQPRKCIIISLIPNLMFVAANIYPVVWLMGPVSLFQGVALAIIWNAMSTYITLLSRGRAQKKNEAFERVSNNFFGIFCLFYQSYHIIGNVIASLVLMPSGSAAGSIISNSSLLMNTTNVTDVTGSQEGILFEMNAPVPIAFEVDGVPAAVQGNVTLNDVTHLRFCGAEFCNHYEVGGSGVAVSNETKYLLFGIYMACIVVAMLIAMFFLEPLNPRLFASTISPMQKMKKQLISLIKFTADKNFLLLFPLMVYTFMQFGFVTGEVTMAFITCPLGIHMVGYTMVCYGVCGSLSSYISGLLSKCTGRMPLILTGGLLNLGVLVFMTQWRPTPDSLVPFFFLMSSWGISEGIWNCQVNSLMGVVFPDKYEEAYAALRFSQGLGVAVMFGYSNYVCMMTKIYIIGAICVLAMVSYLIMEVRLRRGNKQKNVIIRQTSV